MRWSHRVDPIWLADRKLYLTASDIKKLIPVTATGKLRANTEEAYLKVWADKQCTITEDDVCSSGAMARGHLLEPYAIEEFNKLGVLPKLYHWDDALVHSPDAVSCSPDSLDMEQPAPDSRVSFTGSELPATVMGEVKAYSGAAHYAIGLADKMTLEERWQIATAFYTIPTLVRAALIMFNPSAQHPVFYHLYTRAELKDELDMIEQVSNEYWTAANKFEMQASAVCPPAVKNSCILEEDIIAELEEEAAIDAGLNP